MVTETATRKRIFSMQHSERNPSWISSPFVPFTPFGLANGSEITPPFEKRLRTMKKPISTFKWEPAVPGIFQFSPGNGFKNVEVKTPLPAAWRPIRGASQGLSTLPTVRASREKYERVKEELKERDSWYAKLDYSTGLAENALDVVGRPTYGLKLTLGPTESYYQKYVNARRELEDYKRVVQAVNSFVPLVSSEKNTLYSSLESLRRRGSNLQQGPRNLYNIQGGGIIAWRMGNFSEAPYMKRLSLRKTSVLIRASNPQLHQLPRMIMVKQMRRRMMVKKKVGGNYMRGLKILR
jgi:hypothetical protein